MGSKNKNVKSYLQKRLLSKLVSFLLCLCLCQSAFAISSESTATHTSMSSDGKAASPLTLQVSSISPQDGAILTSFPTNLEIKVTRGDLPVQGATVQFWMEGGSVDAFMHNAGITLTDSSGYAHLALLNQNTLDPGRYIWYASALKAGFKGGSSKVISFVIPLTENNGTLTNSGATFGTDQLEYSVGSGNGVSVVIYGNVNNYHLGEPIIIKITSPSGKVIQLVAYGTYLGAFQTVYKLGQDSELGRYTLSLYHDQWISFTSIFYVIK